MHKNFSILAFIGARGGSKDLKNKNIVPFSGKPLIQWTIEAALGSKYIDRTIVSTDDTNIAEVAKRAHADVPFLRPKALSGDTAAVSKAIDHCIDWIYQKENKTYDYVMMLQPTSPLRFTSHIDDAIQYYFNNKTSSKDTLISVINAHKKTGWLMQKTNNHHVDFCFDISKKNPQRQSLPEYYFPNGAIYLSPIKRNKPVFFFTQKTLFYKMPPLNSIDIDTAEDLLQASENLKHLQSKA